LKLFILKYLTRNYDKCTKHLLKIHYTWQISKEHEYFLHVFKNYLNINFQSNSCSGIEFVRSETAEMTKRTIAHLNYTNSPKMCDLVSQCSFTGLPWKYRHRF